MARIMNQLGGFVWSVSALVFILRWFSFTRGKNKEKKKHTKTSETLELALTGLAVCNLPWHTLRDLTCCLAKCCCVLTYFFLCLFISASPVSLYASSPSYFRGFTLIALKEGREGSSLDDYAGNFEVSRVLACPLFTALTCENQAWHFFSEWSFVLMMTTYTKCVFHHSAPLSVIPNQNKTKEECFHGNHLEFYSSTLSFYSVYKRHYLERLELCEFLRVCWISTQVHISATVKSRTNRLVRANWTQMKQLERSESKIRSQGCEMIRKQL